ncbi:MAG TPA: hypothetical protein VF531_08665 [Bacillota bacterium]
MDDWNYLYGAIIEIHISLAMPSVKATVIPVNILKGRAPTARLIRAAFRNGDGNV